jgi:hypothetical protein
LGNEADEDFGFVRGMAQFSADKQPFQYGEAFRVFRFDLPWEPPRADPEAPLSEA